MTETDSRYDDIEVIVLDDEGIREMVDNALAEAGCTWEEIQRQAAEGRFESRLAHRTWFVVSSFMPIPASSVASGHT